ncbi:energy-coupling factor ABC transporter permease [Methanoregula sp.]|uniref:energy-coupling factor ABC transporter permease n=1 Tax=Methanoregula sp. TaxID=2052170 RepID=UPI00262BB74A|nr:energy-coupling factor ABC transporter permease [Methanoregula sp.]MDD5143827.1 energy-coupling factor ABC transporter permease [Methanoregula sp.]
MAHIHLEDGAFSLTWVLVWWLLALVCIGIALWILRSKGRKDTGRITLAAFVTAAAFALFQVNIPLFGGVHLNLTPLVGILAGPVLGSLVVLVINILSAAIGHGGWGLVGANVLVNLAEVLVAFAVFRGSRTFLPDLFSRAGIATFAGLFTGNLIMIGIILVSGVQGVTQSPEQVLAGLSLIVAVNMGVAVIEALLSGLIVRYIGNVRPDLLGEQKG